jgi:TPP-dependent pyruvate/acetoin dehydrogenase alpha subunit
VGHFEGDPQAYRERADIDAARAADPIARLHRHMAGLGRLDAATAERVRDAVEREIEDAVMFAESSPLPPAEDALADLFVHYPWRD